MSFSASSQSLRLENGHILKAHCKDRSGKWRESAIDLNRVIGVTDGWFIWGGQDYLHHGKDFQLQGTKLVGWLLKNDGNYRDVLQGIELNEKIINSDGRLDFRLM
ncbi:Cyanovirin-N [Kalaharituber pfeilii]|nr:Cyanovirin-N [Kalaharituber pfeilii]